MKRTIGVPMMGSTEVLWGMLRMSVRTEPSPRSLNVAQPTVWKQVHALERQLATKLIEPNRRGCRLTKAGETLVDLVAPAMENIGALKRRFQEACNQTEAHLTVATTPRIMLDDLPLSVQEFERLHPHIRLTFREARASDVPGQVESGQADLGLAPDFGPPRSSSLQFDVCCECEIVLVMPRTIRSPGESTSSRATCWSFRS